MDDIYTLRQFTGRIADIRATLNILADTPDLAQLVDMERVGLLGFGAGGTAALLAVGGSFDCTLRRDYCREAGTLNPYCNPWSADRLDTLCAQWPPRKPLTDRRIKAVAAVSPGFGLLWGGESMKKVRVPLLLVAGTNDAESPLEDVQRLGNLFAPAVTPLIIKGADTGAFMSPCPEPLSEELPDLCRSVEPEEKEEILSSLHSKLGKFFATQLGKPILPPAMPGTE